MQENNTAIHALAQEPMALYAYDFDGMISATDAEMNGKYWCLECSRPVKKRSGKNRVPHFYHIKLSPSCRLYSKSEDHHLLQLQIQDLLPKGESQIERPFREINRISDLVWERKKITFEVQCSPIYPKEVERRIEEYKSLGYSVIWILDDRAYNQRILRPAEPLLRQNGAYYASFRRNLATVFYDQFEILSGSRRIQKSCKYRIDLSHPYLFPDIPLPEKWPNQILNRIPFSPFYCRGDLLHRALCSTIDPSLELVIEHWKELEKKDFKSHWARFILENIKIPLMERLNAILLKRG